jgi:hypothetical protein
MSPFGFRIRFLLPESSRINCESNTLEIPLSSTGEVVLLKSVSKAKITDSDNLTIRGSGFSSADEAYNHGKRVKNALLWCGVCLRIGIDTGKDRATSGVGKVLIDRAKDEGIHLLNDVHGLSVYSEDMPVRFVAVTGSMVIGTPASKFIEEFSKIYKLALEFTDKQSLAIELYNLSHFEASLRARFLSLVSAIECISSPEKLPLPIIAHLDKMIELTKTAINGSEGTNLIDRLRELRRESISRACRKLVESSLGPEAMKLFKTCYDARSKLTHEGRIPKNVDLGTYVPKLDQLVSQLICAVVVGSKNGAV